MESRTKKHTKKIKRLIFASFSSMLLLGVVTYAWFVGMKTVNVSTFDVKIAAIDSLSAISSFNSSL